PGVQLQTPDAGIRAPETLRAFAEPADRAVVDLLALHVAPRRVDPPSDHELGDVARDHAVEQPPRVAPGDQILLERRDVDDRGGIANRGVLAIGMRIVGGGDLMSRPATPGLRPDERRGSR